MAAVYGCEMNEWMMSKNSNQKEMKSGFCTLSENSLFLNSGNKQSYQRKTSLGARNHSEMHITRHMNHWQNEGWKLYEINNYSKTETLYWDEAKGAVDNPYKWVCSGLAWKQGLRACAQVQLIHFGNKCCVKESWFSTFGSINRSQEPDSTSTQHISGLCVYGS